MIDDTRYLANPAQAHAVEIVLFVIIMSLTAAGVLYAAINRKLSQAVPIIVMAGFAVPDFFIKSFEIRACIILIIFVIALMIVWFDRKTPKKPN